MSQVLKICKKKLLRMKNTFIFLKKKERKHQMISSNGKYRRLESEGSAWNGKNFVINCKGSAETHQQKNILSYT